MKSLSISQILQNYRFWIICAIFIVITTIGLSAYYYTNTNYYCDIRITANKDTQIEFTTPTGNHFYENVKANETFLLHQRPIKDIKTTSECEIKFSSDHLNPKDIFLYIISKSVFLPISYIVLCIIIALIQIFNKKLVISTKSFCCDKYELLGHIAFLCMLIFAAIFANERSMQSDSAAQIMQMINDKGFVFYENRYSAFLPQIIPVILIKLNAPLKAVIISYSLSPVIIGYIFYAICTRILKNRIGGLLIISMLPVIQHTFFRSIAETYQLMYFAAFLWVWINHKPRENTISNILYYIVLASSIFLCLFIHPVAIFFVAFIIIFKLIDERNIKDIRLIVGTICFIMLFILKSFITDSSGYDANLISNSIGNARSTLANILNLPIIMTTIEHGYSYIFPAILLAVSTIYYARHKQWLMLSFILGFNILYFLIAIIMYADGIGGTWTIERALLPLVFFTMLPFAKDVLPTLKPNMENIFFCWITILTITFFIGLPYSSKIYTDRIDEIHKIVEIAQKEGKQKLMIKSSECDTRFYEWKSHCLPNATMLISALNDPNKTIYLYREGAEYYESVSPLDSTNIRLPYHGTIDINDLNKNYFSLPPTPFYELKHNDGEYSIEEIHQ